MSIKQELVEIKLKEAETKYALGVTLYVSNMKITQTDIRKLSVSEIMQKSVNAINEYQKKIQKILSSNKDELAKKKEKEKVKSPLTIRKVSHKETDAPGKGLADKLNDAGINEKDCSFYYSDGNVYQLLDWYMSPQCPANNIPERLLHKDLEWMLKRTLPTYVCNPHYWLDIQELNYNWALYGMKNKEFLLYCKFSLFKHGIDPKQQKMYIPFGAKDKAMTAIGTKEFKSFKEKFIELHGKRYNDKTLYFFYETIMTDTELTDYLPEGAIPANVKKQLQTIKTRTKNSKPTKAMLKAVEQAINEGKYETGNIKSDNLIDKQAIKPVSNVNKQSQVQKPVQNNTPEKLPAEIHNAQINKTIPSKVKPTNKLDNYQKFMVLKQHVFNTVVENKCGDGCIGCPGNNRGSCTVTEGNQNSPDKGSIDILFVNSFVYPSEIESHVTNTDPKTKLLRNMVTNIMPEINVAFTAATMCAPPFENGFDANVAHQMQNCCSPLLQLQITSLKPKLIVAVGDWALTALVGNSNHTVKDGRKSFFNCQYDDVAVIPINDPYDINEHDARSLDKYQTDLDFIKEFSMKDSNDSLIRSNINDMSHDNTIDKLYQWEEVEDLILDDWKVGIAQQMYHKHEFTEPMLLFSFHRGDEKIYFNLIDIDYISWECVKEIDIPNRIGVEAIEDASYIKEHRYPCRAHVTNNWKKLPKVDRPRAFESNMPAADKLLTVIKDKARIFEKYDNEDDVIETDMNIAYIDIEVYSEDGFPKAELAKGIVNSFAYNYSKTNLIEIVILADEQLPKKLQIVEDKLKEAKLDNDIDYIITTVHTEHEVLQLLDQYIQRDQPEILTSWNAWFDFNYLINRAKLMRFDDITISPLGIRGYISSKTGLYQPVGAEVIDMLEAYKGTQRRAPRSLKLGFIADKELKITKIDYEGELWQLYNTDKPLFIAYNIFDVILIKRIDAKLQVLSAKLFYRRLMGCSIANIDSNIASGFTLACKYARRKGLYLRNTLPFEKKEGEFTGALTIARKIGIEYLVTDFDQSAMYPSLWNTLNINADTFMFEFVDYNFKEGPINADLMGQIIFQDMANIPIDGEFIPSQRQIDLNKLDYNLINMPVKVKVKPLTWFEGKSFGIIEEAPLGHYLEIINANSWILTLRGTVFQQHSQKVGFYTDIQIDLKAERGRFRKIENGKKEEAIALKDKIEKQNKQMTVQEERTYDDLMIQSRVGKSTQLTRKIAMNALYGAMGNEAFHSFKISLAESITLSARIEVGIVSKDLDNVIEHLENKATMIGQNKVA